MNEQNNTFNKLSGKPLLSTSFWCRFGIHNWEQWSDIKVVEKPGSSLFKIAIQERYCNNCHIHDVLKVKHVNSTLF